MTAPLPAGTLAEVDAQARAAGENVAYRARVAAHGAVDQLQVVARMYNLVGDAALVEALRSVAAQLDDVVHAIEVDDDDGTAYEYRVRYRHDDGTPLTWLECSMNYATAATAADDRPDMWIERRQVAREWRRVP